MIRYCISLLLLVLSISCFGQDEQRLDLIFRYGADLPSADLADRFGLSYNPEIGLQYSKNNLFAGIHGSMMVGPIVKEDVISNLRNSTGQLISQQQDFAIITMKQRGFTVGIHAGIFIPIIKSTHTHGIRLKAGANILTHYIIFNNETASSNQLLGDYARGYDRLTRGFGVEEFIGYQFVNQRGSVKFFAGINSIQGFTKNLRPYNFDTRVRDDSTRFDMLTGFRLGIAFNLYQSSEGKDVFY